MEIISIDSRTQSIETSAGKLVSVEAPGFPLNQIPLTHRVFHFAEPSTVDPRLFIVRDDGQYVAGFSSHYRATRYCEHVIESETRQIATRLEAQTHTKARQLKLLRRHRDVCIKYGLLRGQFQSLQSERRVLELAEVDVEKLALMLSVLYPQQKEVLTQIEGLLSTLQEPTTLVAEGADLLQTAMGIISQQRTKVSERLTQNSLKALPGEWVVIY